MGYFVVIDQINVFVVVLYYFFYDRFIEQFKKFGIRIFECINLIGKLNSDVVSFNFDDIYIERNKIFLKIYRKNKILNFL